jgi:hypothetical protein
MLWRTQRRKYQDFLGLLASSDDPIDTLTAAALGMAVCSAMNVIQSAFKAVYLFTFRHTDDDAAAVLVIDFYLDEKRKSERKEIIELVAAESSPENEELLVGYVREAMRLNPAVSCAYSNSSPRISHSPVLCCILGRRSVRDCC